MPRQPKTIHYLYKTTCLISGRFYIGVHSTNKIDDGYMGSGNLLRYSLRKYGIHNHMKEIMEFFDNRELLIEREKEIVNSDLIINESCMNLVLGGGGFMMDEYHYKCSKQGNEIHNEKLKNDPEYREKYLNNMKNGIKRAWSNGKYDNVNWGEYWRGKKHTTETKLKIGDSNKGKGIGDSNSQFGTFWVTDGETNIKIKNGDKIPDNFKKGRTIKKLPL